MTAKRTALFAAPPDVSNPLLLCDIINQYGDLLNIESLTYVGDADYTILPTDHLVNNNVVFTAARTWTLPSLKAVNPGARLTLIGGGFTTTNTLTVQRAGSDQIWLTYFGGTMVNSVVLGAGVLFFEFLALPASGLWALVNAGAFGIQTFTGTSGTASVFIPSLIFNPSGTFTLTLPAAGTFIGAWFHAKTIAAQAVNSASSNVVPLAGGAAGTAILAATAGKWASLQSDGTNWIIMAAN